MNWQLPENFMKLIWNNCAPQAFPNHIFLRLPARDGRPDATTDGSFAVCVEFAEK